MEFTKSELHRRGDDMSRKGWTTRFYHDFLDSVWREPFINRTSGFDEAGGPDSVIAFDNNTRVFSISPATNKFAFWQFIVRIAFFKRYEPMELEIPDEEGLYLIYLFRDEEDKTHKRQKLFYTKNPTLDETREIYLNRVIVAWVYWACDLQEALYFGDSRHGSEWNPQMHWWTHQTLNSLRQDGLAVHDMDFDTDGSENGDYQFGITAGSLWHEDILWEMEAVGTADALPVWFFDAAGLPRFTSQTGKKFLNTGTGRVAHNSPAGGLAEAPDMHFVVYHLFATNCKLHPVISVAGKASHATQGAAVGSIEAEVTDLRLQLPHSNLMHIGSFVLQTSDSFTNSGRTRIVYATGDGIGITNVYALPDPVFPIDYLFYTLGGNDFYITDIPKANGLLWGGVVTWITGLTFSVSPAAFYINGILYTTGWSLVTLEVADDTHPRIDIIVVNTDGTVSAIAGTPAANPQKPQPDPLTQIELTQILVPALATEPDGITGVVIYDENTEWTASFAGVAVNFNSATDPFSGAVCANISNVSSGSSVTFTAASPVQVSSFETLSFFLKLKELMTKQHYLRVQFFLSGAPVSDVVALLPNINTVNEWQNIALLLSNFSFSSATFNAVRFDWQKQGAQTSHAGFYLDLVKLEAGIEQPSTGKDGKDGEDGLSAYQIAVLNGFQGTEAQWLESLKGEDGNTPVKGIDYFDGNDGITPHIGLNGNWWIGETDTGIPAQGTNGKEVEFRENAGYVEWRYVSDATWTQLYLIPTGGGIDNSFDVYIDFLDTTAFTYNCPAALKFTQVISESTAPALSVSLNTNMAQFDKLTVTPAAVGLVILKGELL